MSMSVEVNTRVPSHVCVYVCPSPLQRRQWHGSLGASPLWHNSETVVLSSELARADGRGRAISLLSCCQMKVKKMAERRALAGYRGWQPFQAGDRLVNKWHSIFRGRLSSLCEGGGAEGEIKQYCLGAFCSRICLCIMEKEHFLKSGYTA